MKFWSLHVLAAVAIIALIGCSTGAIQKQESEYVPSFDFTPPSTAPAGSADVTFAIVNASYSETQGWTQVYPFTEVSRNMGLDFQEIVSARGYTVRGPLNTYDEMAFPDKKGSDLVLEPRLEIRLEIINPKNHRHVQIIGNDEYSMSSEAALSGRVTLSLNESLSRERMWFKSVELSRVVVPWQGEKRYTGPLNQVDISDPGITKPLAKPMEDFYKKVMEAAWKYLDPEEMRIVKKQAEDIKKKKVY